MQDNVLQWVCPLIYNNTQGISSANDLIQIMVIGKSALFKFVMISQAGCLMKSELPTALNVFDADYQLEYNESYSSTVH